MHRNSQDGIVRLPPSAKKGKGQARVRERPPRCGTLPVNLASRESTEQRKDYSPRMAMDRKSNSSKFWNSLQVFDSRRDGPCIWTSATILLVPNREIRNPKSFRWCRIGTKTTPLQASNRTYFKPKYTVSSFPTPPASRHHSPS